MTHLRELKATNGWVRFETVDSFFGLIRGILWSFYRYHQPPTRGRTRGHTERSPCVLDQESDVIFADAGGGKLAIVGNREPRPAFLRVSLQAPDMLKYTTALVHRHAQRAARIVPVAAEKSEGPNDPRRLDEQGVGIPGKDAPQPAPRAVDDVGDAQDPPDDPAAMIDVASGGVGDTPPERDGQDDDEGYGRRNVPRWWQVGLKRGTTVTIPQDD
eukprot:jgi/Undpi1/5217/HiC_scaffold_2.g00499.m1